MKMQQQDPTPTCNRDESATPVTPEPYCLRAATERWAQAMARTLDVPDCDPWSRVLPELAADGLTALHDALTMETGAPLVPFVDRFCLTLAARGIEVGPATEALLLCKEAVDATFPARSSNGHHSMWQWGAEMDRWLREMARRLVTTYAGTSANENKRLFDRSVRHLEEHQSIQRVMSVLLEEVDLEQVLGIVCAEARRLMGAGGASVYFLNKEGWLQLAGSDGSSPGFVMIPAEDSLAGMALREGRLLVAQDAARDPRLYNLLSAPKPTNIVVAPLSATAKTIGVLYLADKPEAFSGDDIRLIQLFAFHAAVALLNARLREQVRSMATLHEQERLAREIHDSLAQYLGILKLQASRLIDLLDGGDVQEARRWAAHLRDTTTNALGDAREAIYNLRHTASCDEEFGPALRDFLAHFSRSHGVAVEITAPEDAALTLPRETCLQVSRIIQEALSNVRKHAHARRVAVELARKDGFLCIHLSDDGCGFDLDSVVVSESGGAGLQIIRERAESLGGRLEIASRVGHGTRITARVPLLAVPESAS